MAGLDSAVESSCALEPRKNGHILPRGIVVDKWSLPCLGPSKSKLRHRVPTKGKRHATCHSFWEEAPPFSQTKGEI